MKLEKQGGFILKIQKWLVSLGLLSVIFFIIMDLVGCLSWSGYNPISDYISKYLSEEAPNVVLTKTLMNLYNICFCVYAITMASIAFQKHSPSIRIGFIILSIISLISLWVYGAIPISMEWVFIANDITHILVSILIISLIFIALIFLSFGYSTKSHFKSLGRLCSIVAGCYLLLNLWHILTILNGGAIIGLIERLTFYAFHLTTFMISWTYAKHLA